MSPLAERKSSLGWNSFWLLLARVTAQGLNVLFVALAARRLGVTVFGEFNVLAAVVILGNAFTTFGTETLIIRETSRSGQISSLAARTFGLQLILSALFWLTAFLARASPPLLVYALSLFPLALISVTSALLRAFERMDLYWALSLLGGLTQCAAIYFSPDLPTLCLFLFFGQTLVALLAYGLCSASLPDFRLFPSLDVFPLLRAAFPFAAMTTLSVLTSRLGIFAVSTFVSNPETGLFASSVRVTEALKLGHYAILGASLPMLSRGAMDSAKRFRSSLWMMLAVSALFAGCTAFLARPLSVLLFGAEFASASDALVILVWSLIPYTVGAFISVALVARGREYDLLKAMSIALVAFLLLYFFLTRQHGMIGAAWAGLIGELIQAIVLVITLRKT
ncbi:MAG: oligosaccharide flippase family protein [Chloroflexi bacterium]|nr:oligosaccharide flippase family protein [Chloroflexota bacterium]